MQQLPYSKIIRIFREKQDITLRQLSMKTFFGFQTLSKYELELIPISDDNFEVIANILSIDIKLVNYINSSLLKDLDKLYESIVYDYTDEIERIYQVLLQSNEYISYSYLNYYYEILMFSMDIINGVKNPIYLRNILDNKDKIDSKYIQIFYDYYAIYISRCGQLEDSLTNINSAISIGRKSNISSMIHYHAGLLYSLRGKLKLALYHNLEAEYLFIQEHNHIRLISVQTNIATLYARQNDIQKALEIYQRLLKEAQRSLNYDIELVTQYNIAWCYYKINDNLSSNNILHEIEKTNELSVNGNYIKAANLIALKREKEAQEIIDIFINKEVEPLFQTKFELLNYENQNKLNEEYCSKLILFLNETKVSYDYENTEFILDKLIDYHEIKHMYKTANYYLKEKIKLIDNKYAN